MTKNIAAVWFLVGLGVGAAAIGAYNASAQSSGGVGTWQLGVYRGGTTAAAWRLNTVTGALHWCLNIPGGSDPGWQCIPIKN